MPDEAAFARLVREYKDMVFAVSLLHTRDRALAEDVSQEVFLKAFRSMDGMREPERMKTWLFSIARNTAIDHARRRGRGPVSLDANPVEPAVPAAEPAEPDERAAKVKKVIDSLQEDYREILLLRYMKGLSYREIGEILGLTTGAVGEKLCRIRKVIQLRVQTT